MSIKIDIVVDSKDFDSKIAYVIYICAMTKYKKILKENGKIQDRQKEN